MAQGRSGLTIPLLECDRHHPLQGNIFGHAVVLSRDDVAVLIGESIGGDDALQRDDLMVDAGGAIVLAPLAAHAIEILSTNEEVALDDG